jgi:hypothetical protein
MTSTPLTFALPLNLMAESGLPPSVVFGEPTCGHIAIAQWRS